MSQTNHEKFEESLLERGRELLTIGDIQSAVEFYGQASDPDGLDEAEARELLIEARSHLSRKHLLEALEYFEEALLVGNEAQRRQALEGIASTGEIFLRVNSLRESLERGLKRHAESESLESFGLVHLGPQENLVAISKPAAAALPPELRAGRRILALPDRLTDQPLPFSPFGCIAYTDEPDVDYILQIVAFLAQQDLDVNQG